MAPCDRSCTTFYSSAIVSTALSFSSYLTKNVIAMHSALTPVDVQLTPFVANFRLRCIRLWSHPVVACVLNANRRAWFVQRVRRHPDIATRYPRSAMSFSTINSPVRTMVWCWVPCRQTSDAVPGENLSTTDPVRRVTCCVEETVCQAAGVIPSEGSKLLIGRYR